MKNFTLITALSLCSFSWISVSGSESQTVEAQLGEEVTLLSTNMSEYDSVTFWVKLVNGTKASCITVKIRADDEVKHCNGFKKGKYEMTSNISMVFLRIKHVDLSDSGLYLCGFYQSGRPNFTVINLHVKGSDESHDDVDSKCKKSDGIAKLVIVVLGSLTIVLVMVIIGLVVKNRKHQTANKEEQKPEQSENADSDLNYAAVAFRPKANRRQPEPNVIYAATR